MLVEDKSLLHFIRLQRCAFCGALPPSEAAHCWPRGMGGGSRLDVWLNLLPACHECHGRYEGDREAMFTKIAERNGLESWEVARDAVWRLLRTPRRERA